MATDNMNLDLLPERFWDKVRIDPETGCWNWIAANSGKDGYGRFWWNGSGQGSHRVSYETLVMPIPEGLVLDHICRNTGCCNPAHLEPVTHRVNCKRGHQRNSKKTHCANGHEFTASNTRITKLRNGNTRRTCRSCARDCMRRIRSEK